MLSSFVDSDSPSSGWKSSLSKQPSEALPIPVTNLFYDLGTKDPPLCAFFFLITNHKLERHRHGFLNFLLLSAIQTPTMCTDLSLAQRMDCIDSYLIISPISGPGLSFGAHRTHFHQPRGWGGIGRWKQKLPKTRRDRGWEIGRTLKNPGLLLIFQQHQEFKQFAQGHPMCPATSSFISSSLHQISIEHPPPCPGLCTECWRCREETDMLLLL